MSGSSYTNVFGGSVVRPSNPSYEALTISANTTLYWPLETTEGNPVVAASMDITATTTGLSLIMPTGNTGSTGVVSMITNRGANSFTVKASDGTLIATIATTQSWLIQLVDNSTAAGSWTALQMASTTSSASAASLAGPGLEANGSLLQLDLPSHYLNANTNITSAYRGSAITWTGAAGTLQLDTLANLGDGWACWISNDGSGTLTIMANGAETINGAASLTMNPGNSGVIIAGSTQFTSFGALINVLSILNGGTGASTSDAALTNLGGTSIGKSIFTAPNSASILAILGLTNQSFTESTVGTNQSPGVGSGNTIFVATAGITINLPLTTSVTTAYVLGIRATGGAVTLTPQPTDNIDSVGAGVNYTIPNGGNAFIFTDANGRWWLLSGPAIRASTINSTGNATISGDFFVGGHMAVGSATGNISTDGNLNVGAKMSVDGATGNTFAGGTLSASGDFKVASTKFTVASATGNTAVAGTLNVTGVGTFASTVSAANGVTGTNVVNYSQFAPAFAANGRFSIPSGILVQWGPISVTTGALDGNGIAEGLSTASFSTAFSSAPYVVFVCANDVTGTGQQEMAWVTSKTTTQVGFGMSCRTATQAMTGYYIAIGAA